MNGVELVDVAPSDLVAQAQALLAAGGRMQMAYAWFPASGSPLRGSPADAATSCTGAPELRYLAAPGAGRPFVLWRVRPSEAVPSLAAVAPLMGWYEREITDLTGVRFQGHPEPYPLVLHEVKELKAPPLHPAFSGAELEWTGPGRYLPEVKSRDVQLLPFGPVRADVTESAEFLFFYIGEGILHYHPRLFFKHRGMEKRFEGLSAELGVLLAERVSGVGSLSHALAYCQAVEAAAGIAIPQRARWLRVLLAELERLYNHLHYLGYLCHTTTLKVGEAEGKLLEERVKQLNGRLTGSRFLRGLLTPGGLRRDLDPKALGEELEALRREFATYVAWLERTDSHLDRLITTGVLPRQVAFDQGATGPVERASGFDRDLRRDHPYAAYGELPVKVAVKETGDAYARMQVRIEEIDASVALIQRLLLLLPRGPVRAECRPQPGSEGLGWTEAPRGSLYYAVHLNEAGQLARVKIRSPSFSNWRAFPFTVHDTNMMDYAINEASFGLTIAGCDR